MAREIEFTLDDLLPFFPVVDPPFTLTEESIHHIKQVNDYLPEILAQSFLAYWERDEDELTEYFPCLRLPSTDIYHALVYWKASLLKYEYILVTLEKNGNLISRKVISGVFVDSGVIKKSAARIDQDNIIHIMVGASLDDDDYDPNNSQSMAMEIMPNGEIIVND